MLYLFSQQQVPFSSVISLFEISDFYLWKRETEKRRLTGEKDGREMRKCLWMRDSEFLDDNISLLFWILHVAFPPKKGKLQLVCDVSYFSSPDLYLSVAVCLQMYLGSNICAFILNKSRKDLLRSSIIYCEDGRVFPSWPSIGIDMQSLACCWLAGVTSSGTDLKRITW